LLRAFLFDSGKDMNKFKLISLAVLVAIGGCSTTSDKNAGLSNITIFSINDFHGNLQSDQPVPYLASKADAANPGKTVNVPSGGYAYLAAKLKSVAQRCHPAYW
jgi:5'-nucleotidase